jgi:cyclic-di-AMP phosphodiesterase PgpH
MLTMCASAGSMPSMIWPLARRLLSKAAALLILPGVGAGAGLLLSPGVSSQRLPYGDASLGRVATQTVRARRDYDILDEEATRKRREEAQGDVRPVYDYDSHGLGEVRSRIAESFARLREEVAPATDSGEGHEHKVGVTKLAPGDLESLRQELMGRLQALVDPRDFQRLAEEGFSPAAERTLADLVSSQMQHLILEDRTLLPSERARGIYVRALPEGTPGSEVVQDLDTLKDLTGARLDVERAAADVKDLPASLRRVLGHLARGALRANLTYDAAETARRRDQAFNGVAPVVLQLHRGEPILSEGERIEPNHLLIFRAIRDQTQPLDVASARLGAGLFAVLLAYLCYRFARFLNLGLTRKDQLFLALLLLSGLALSRGLLVSGELLREGVSLPSGLASRLVSLGPPSALGEALDYAIPMTLGSALAALLLGPMPALLFALLSAGLVGLLRESSLSFALLSLSGSLLVVRRLRGVATSGAIFRAFLWVGLCNVALVGCFALFGGRFLGSAVVAEALASFVGGGLLTALLCFLLLPLCEVVFGYASDRRLLGFSNLNHPALKELIVRAPGTYHHSIMLAGLCEGAARAIGADAVLARTIALYHDLGKGKNPLAFNENQKALGRIELSDPLKAAQQLKQHVEDGLEIARRHRVPKVVLDAIAQHHGTRPVAHFRAQVKALSLDVDAGDPAFVYQGPKPRTREVALLMLADVVEAASRTPALGNSPMPIEIEGFVRAIVAELVADGQFEECALSLIDLRKLTISLARDLQTGLAARAAGSATSEVRTSGVSSPPENRLRLN